MNYDKLTKEQLLGIHKDTLEYLNEQEQEIERLNKELNTYKYRPKTRFRDVIELRDRIEKLEKENNLLKQLVGNDKQYTTGIR